MNTVDLEKVSRIIKILSREGTRQRVLIPLSEETSLSIMRHSAVVEKGSSSNSPMYLVSFRKSDYTTFNKNKLKNVYLFTSLVGEELYGYLERLVYEDKERHFNKGSGIGYQGLSIDQIQVMLSYLIKHNQYHFDNNFYELY